MNDMFRRPDQAPLRPGDVIRAGHEDWNDRIKRAIAGETAWKHTAWAVLALLTASGAFNVWQAQQSMPVRVIHVVHDKVGNIITVQAERDGLAKPTPAMIAAALKDWVTNVRTVGVDVMAMRHAITDAYKLIGSGESKAMLDRFYQSNDPFKRATMETVNVSDPVAIPPPPATLGKDDLQTWRVQWTEQVLGRDGLPRSLTDWFLTVTFTITSPKSKQEADDDPDGIHMISFALTQQ
jgi:type IV secretory pathway TrbF-like protein